MFSDWKEEGCQNSVLPKPPFQGGASQESHKQSFVDSAVGWETFPPGGSFRQPTATPFRAEPMGVRGVPRDKITPTPYDHFLRLC